MSLRLVTANDLRDGAVVFLTATADERWSKKVGDAGTASSTEEEEAMLRQATQSARQNVVVEPYLIDAEIRDGAHPAAVPGMHPRRGTEHQGRSPRGTLKPAPAAVAVRVSGWNRQPERIVDAHHMYRYHVSLSCIVMRQRVAQFRDQVTRRLHGELTEEEFRPLRLMNGLYLQLHAYMLRIAIPYGTPSSRQMRQLAHIAHT